MQQKHQVAIQCLSFHGPTKANKIKLRHYQNKYGYPEIERGRNREKEKERERKRESERACKYIFRSQMLTLDGASQKLSILVFEAVSTGT